MWFLKKKPKTINLIDFSVQELSSGQVVAMLKHLESEKSSGFKFVNENYRTNDYGDTRCFLTIDHEDRGVIQWFKDRNQSQVEEFAKSFKVNLDKN
ncbi:hypothetical protein P4V88_02305 [Bacillus thuringiensis]|uniref:hypothetical protein n=1 Tax=Bacillus thuringiensis TaxID=1428 RepID=UPI000A3C2A2B|nr:hypothetical protein [Bacillus thuringiensis]MED2125974.1 hypothetical protein [Bacillus thuringiensis]MED2148671.1 hypothetical protein [Bacillus thuringiensis]MED2170807.1 hypothetical protein [Bacillus thuringiensis]MED2475906.1 hypothetical protein [Bacillus thuringiensis]MED2577218.1 hypothetical protein [Bacillus thuringiensis]